MRTQEEILQEMDEEFAKHPELSDLNNNNSAVSLWQLLKKMWVTLVQLLESRWDNLKAMVDARIVATKTGSTKWYVKQVLAFQLGDSLDVIDGVAGYAVVDEQKRIVVQATATENRETGRISIRLAKSASANELAALEDGEVSAVREYVHQIKIPGVPIDVFSLPADEVKITARVRVDPQKITTIGTDVADADKYPVISAISAYLRSLPDDSVLSWTALTDHLQATPGVRDFVISETAIRRPGTSVWIPAGSAVESPAGHAILHADSVLTYIS